MELYLEVSHLVVFVLRNPALYLVLRRVSESWHGGLARLLWLVDFERHLILATVSEIFIYQSIGNNVVALLSVLLLLDRYLGPGILVCVELLGSLTLLTPLDGGLVLKIKTHLIVLGPRTLLDVATCLISGNMGL